MFFIKQQTYMLFDNVLLMAEGMVIYHGKRENVMPYFNSLGWEEGVFVVEGGVSRKGKEGMICKRCSLCWGVVYGELGK